MKTAGKEKSYGFTLIEVMAAMAILAAILLIVGRMMIDTTDAYDAGISSAEINDSGRAIFDFIARDISNAIGGDTNLTFSVESAAQFDYGFGDELRFISLSGDPDSSERSPAQVIYYMREMKRREGDYTGRYQLMRAVQSSAANFTASRSDNWWTAPNAKTTAAVIAENVSRFYVYTYVNQTNYTGSSVLPISEVNFPGLGTPEDFNSTDITSGNMPLFVDVYLELLGEKDSIQIGTLFDQGVNVEERVLDRAKRFFGRVYLHNREGYQD